MRVGAVVLGTSGGLLAFAVALFDIAMMRSDVLVLILLVAGSLGLVGTFWLLDDPYEGPILILLAAAGSVIGSISAREPALASAMLLLAAAALAWFGRPRSLRG